MFSIFNVYIYTIAIYQRIFILMLGNVPLKAPLHYFFDVLSAIFCKTLPPLQTKQRQAHGFFHGHLHCFERVEFITTLHFQIHQTQDVCGQPEAYPPEYILQTSWRYVEIHQKIHHYPGPIVTRKPNRVDLHRKTTQFPPRIGPSRRGTTRRSDDDGEGLT